jgi:ferric iron reductase protein FhuF
VSATGVYDALRRAGEVGPYFALESSPSDGWLPLSVLLTDRAVLADRVRLVRATIASGSGLAPEQVQERACASIHFLALASRLLAPALGAAALCATVPWAEPDDVSWCPVDGGPIPMSWARATGAAVRSAAEAAALIDSGVLSRLVAPLVQSFAATFRLSGQVLWGNAASALAGAATMVATSGRATALDPVDIVTACMGTGALAGTGAYRATVAGRSAFRRANCCLFYRIPGAGLCGDCVLAPPAGRARTS